jgi:hypothetical protein
LENVKGVKRKGRLCAGGLQCRFSKVCVESAELQSADTLRVAANPPSHPLKPHTPHPTLHVAAQK